MDIGRGTTTYFRWVQPDDSHSKYQLNILAERNHKWGEEITNFMHTTLKNLKLVSYSKHNLVIVAGAKHDLQFQVIEAFMEYLLDEFFDLYEFTLNSFVHGEESLLEGFSQIVEDAFTLIPKERVVKLKTYCRACGNAVVEIFVKKSLVDEAPSHPVALVHQHAGHNLLIFVDAKYQVRGTQLVSING